MRTKGKRMCTAAGVGMRTEGKRMCTAARVGKWTEAAVLYSVWSFGDAFTSAHARAHMSFFYL